MKSSSLWIVVLTLVFLAACAHSPNSCIMDPPHVTTVVTPATPDGNALSKTSAEHVLLAPVLIKDMQIDYAPKQATVSNQDKDSLKKVASVLVKNSKFFQHVEIIGHADKEGTDDFNLDISKKRALTISEVLKSAGLTNSQIQTSWLGDTEPSKSMPLQNRRVELKFYGLQKSADFDKFIEDLNKID